ncbi:MAG: alcohol dehydrogenase [Proteobacteria bacterium]|nr:alcohol dehydrogenase [Pseudomonadota bacterium]
MKESWLVCKPVSLDHVLELVGGSHLGKSAAMAAVGSSPLEPLPAALAHLERGPSGNIIINMGNKKIG